MKLMISTGSPSARCQWVMSDCQVSLGSADSKRIQLERGGVASPVGRRVDSAVVREPEAGNPQVAVVA